MKTLVALVAFALAGIGSSFTITLQQVTSYVKASSAYVNGGGLPTWLSHEASAVVTSAPFFALREVSHWRTDTYQYGGQARAEIQATLNSSATDLYVAHLSRLFVKAQDGGFTQQHGSGKAEHALSCTFSVDDWAILQLSTQHYGEILWDGTGTTKYIQHLLLNNWVNFGISSIPTNGYLSNGYRYFLPAGTHTVRQQTFRESNSGETLFVYPGYELQSHEGWNYRTNTALWPSAYWVIGANLIQSTNQSVEIIDGLPFGGSSQSLRSSDNDRLYLLCDENQPNATLVTRSTYPLTSVNGLRIRMETSATRNDLIERVSLWQQWQLGSNYILIDARLSSLVDNARKFDVRSAWPNEIANQQLANHYVNPQSGEVKCHIQWIPTQDLEAADGWLVSIDELSAWAPQ